jgi:flagellar export protein FliJ
VKPFSFRLKSVLKYRNYQEKNARKNLLIARDGYSAREKEIEKLTKKKMDTAREISKETVKGIDAWRYDFYRSFLKRLEQDLETAYCSLREAEKEVKEKQKILKKASINKKTLETLEDLQSKRYVEDLNAEEQKTMDELAITAGGR